ncbi:glyoxylase-like metal-dependent hydrolase (beta-lactamase superfamily II) [Streptomyces sp. SAI-208]|uniref:MBL fold metallo-hydrolase n=1 Tax=Streptomyces sp. SAI-208 TaxID=2940550 RepID=UPI00247434D0|nr:MBL fold metallo-hydrolase [Streptomyces sp. SAI-208]MDH6604746.1 glyoxylase-like metal-dependent hydrolase (beta-lactamase superfamily II) [Streptomyces sp. SAI-208]
MPTSGPLAYDVLVADPIPQNVTDLVPNGDRRMFSPLSVTLIHGEQDAVLVDPPLTSVQAQEVGDWVEDTGKNLTHIFATHGHGDHWFTAGVLAERFGAQVVASEGTIAQMHRNVSIRPHFWDALFPGQIPDAPVTAVTVPGNRFTLEGHDLHIVEVGHSDTDETSVLHVPDLELVVAGDVIYNGVHQYLAESANGGRDAWRKAITVVEGLRPRRIVTGHKNKERDDDAERAIAETRLYLDTVDELLAKHEEPLGFFNAMLERFPDRLNPGALWGGAVALYR